MKFSIRIAAVALAAFFAMLSVSAICAKAEEPAASAKKLNAAVVTGGHPYNEKEFFKIFQGHDDIVYKHLPQKNGGELFDDISHWPYDVIVLYNFNQTITPKEQANFLKLLDRGVGLVILHHANAAYRNWPEFWKIAGVEFHFKPWEKDGKKMPASGHRGNVRFKVHVADPDHPITRGIKDYAFHDETYIHDTIDPGVHVLLTTENPTSEKTLSWVKTYGKSRVFYIQSGHDEKAFKNPIYRKVVIRGIRWSAGELNDSGSGSAAENQIASDSPKLGPILTPKPPLEPRINGPRLFGVRPGKPFIYRIPCTGRRPMRFAVDNLPSSLKLDVERGIISGTAPTLPPGRRVLTLRAQNAHGKAQKEFMLAIGDTLALTPPMGWNSWYIFYNRVTEDDMRAAADAMVASGMADVGYMYVNIDDCWMKKHGDKPYRGADGAVLPNAKFSDIKGMVDYIHGKGLRAGIYTSPGPWTCQTYVGAYKHEQEDARQFAAWGFDFLKYDWCSYNRIARNKSLEEFQKPYRKMGRILKTLDRDIVFNLCQYGMGDVWKWGGDVGGNCWRTTGDLGLKRGDRLPGFYHIGLSNARHWQYAKPGQWNDPDYLLIGWVGDAHKMGEGHPTALNANEQYSYMSMWCLMAAPLFFSGDMTKLDAFTLNVLCNPEVIEVDQDALGRQAKIIRQSDEELVLAKPMEDGSLSVGLFNLSEKSREIRATWTELGLAGRQRMRDLWRQKDLAGSDERITAKVEPHGVILVRLFAEP
ncbi:MAG: ThuA domain-containing protein [Thermoguttaceae bacterium]